VQGSGWFDPQKLQKKKKERKRKIRCMKTPHLFI
jgi:hypothetical protein